MPTTLVRPRLLVASIIVLVVALNISGCIKKESTRPAPAPTQVRFREQKAFPDHYLPFGQPWSPAHDRLVIQGNEGLAVFDAAEPESGLRQVFSAGWVRQVTWSPDGDWLLLVIGDPNPANLRSLIAVPWRGGACDTLVKNVTFFPAVWASDGNVAYTTGKIVHWIKPPHGSSPLEGNRSTAPSLVTRLGRGVQWIKPGKSEGESLAVRVRGEHILIADTVPEIGRYLIRGIAAESSSVLILDSKGEIVADLAAAGIPFEPSGLSGDGSLIIGYKEVDKGDDISSCQMYVAASSGDWSKPVQNVPAAIKACFSRVGGKVAYEDPIKGGVHVGMLSILP